MALNALTLDVSTGIQGERFRSALLGTTAGTRLVLGSDTAVIGGGVVNNVLDHPALPFGKNAFEVVEIAPSGEKRTTRLIVDGVSRAAAYIAGDAALPNGRVATNRRFAGTLQVNGSIAWNVIVRDDLGNEYTTAVGAAVIPPDNGLAPAYTGATSITRAENSAPTQFTVTFDKLTHRDFLFGPDSGWYVVLESGPALSFTVQKGGGNGFNFEKPVGINASGYHPRNNFHSLKIRPRSSANGLRAAATDVQVNISDVAEQPNSFTFTTLTNQARNTRVYSEVITISGLGAGVSAIIPAIAGLVAGDGLQKNGAGGFVSGPLSVVNGDTLQAAVTTDAAYATTKTVAGTIGDPPLNFSFAAATLADPSAVPSFTYTGAGMCAVDAYANTSFTFNAVDVGTAKSTRKVQVAIHTVFGGVDAVTVNGNAAVKVTDAGTPASNWYEEVWQADCPTGTTADIVVTGGAQVIGVLITTTTDVNGTPTFVGRTLQPTGYQDPHTVAVTVPTGGFALCFGFFESTTNPVATGGAVVQGRKTGGGKEFVCFTTTASGAQNPGVTLGDSDRQILALAFGA